MWSFFGGAKAQKESEEESSARSGPGGTAVDMTTLDITYITHRLLGVCGCLEYFIFILAFLITSPGEAPYFRLDHIAGAASCLRRVQRSMHDSPNKSSSMETEV